MPDLFNLIGQKIGTVEWTKEGTTYTFDKPDGKKATVTFTRDGPTKDENGGESEWLKLQRMGEKCRYNQRSPAPMNDRTCLDIA